MKSDEIKNKVNEASFISAQADETRDCATHAHPSIIIRHVHEIKTCERFLGFYEVSDDKSAERLIDAIATTLSCFDNATNKFVAMLKLG